MQKAHKKPVAVRRTSRLFCNDVNADKAIVVRDFLHQGHDVTQYFVDLFWQRQDFSTVGYDRLIGKRKCRSLYGRSWTPSPPSPTPWPPPHALKAEALCDPLVRAEYDALEAESTLFAALLHARNHAGLTQTEVAERMGTTTSAVARLESSGGSKKHSPSVATLRKYAEAVGA